ncbi:hypothetical protein KP509_04G059500 [Ceratopteris richardii]|uniref:Uncharacterized protein n=1 Tax=Ceratopteris richardii TaxID=49495 RepID=A0A8T2UVW5_CERRI|nr:hypothetical protein KP509_04G059500 [Ceratopteris richardii]
MSRCYPFPPPGYVKNAPLDLEFSSKKEKHKHKKKKKKRHSAANNEPAAEESNEQSRKTNGGLNRSAEKSTDLVNNVAIKRLQTQHLECQSGSSPSVARVSEQEQLIESRDEMPLSMLAAERMHLDSVRMQVLSNGVHGSKSLHIYEAMKPTMAGLNNSDLAAGSKNMKAESSRALLVSGSRLASDSVRPEKPVKPTFSNGVLSTKRKRLQADSTFPKSMTPSDLNRSNQLQGVSSSTSIMDVQATNCTKLQTGDSQSQSISINGLLPRGSQQRSHADNSRLKMDTDAACFNVFSAEKERVKETSNRLFINNSELKGAEYKRNVQLNGALATSSSKMQTDCLKFKTSSSDAVTSSSVKGEKRQQAAKSLPPNGIQGSGIYSINDSDGKWCSGSAMARNYCNTSDQRLQPKKSKPVLNSVPNARSMEKKESAHAVQLNYEQKSCSKGSRQDFEVSSERNISSKVDRIHNMQHQQPNGYKHSESGWKTDGSKNGVILNGKLTHEEVKPQSIKMSGNSVYKIAHCQEKVESIQPVKVPNGSSARLEKPEADKVDYVPCSSASDAKNTDIENMTNSMSNENFISKMLKLRVPHTEQSWVTADEEDWLVPCKHQLQPNHVEKVEDPIPQVWAESAFLPAVSVNALPYVIPY